MVDAESASRAMLGSTPDKRCCNSVSGKRDKAGRNCKKDNGAIGRGFVSSMSTTHFSSYENVPMVSSPRAPSGGGCRLEDNHGSGIYGLQVLFINRSFTKCKVPSWGLYVAEASGEEEDEEEDATLGGGGGEEEEGGDGGGGGDQFYWQHAM